MSDIPGIHGLPIAVTQFDGDPVRALPMEFVERKGIGHPDSLCDGIAEAVSRALSRHYLDVAGRILHHNTDKVQLVAGRAKPTFGGGRVTRPIYVLIGGRATNEYRGRRISVHEIARHAASEHLKRTVPTLRPEAVEFDVRIGGGSGELRGLFDRTGTPRANDTSVGVGYAPLSPLERIVRTLEPRLRREIPEVGEDVKIMGLRRGQAISLTIAAAVIAGQVADLDAYLAVKARIRELAERAAREHTDASVEVAVNAADDPDAGAIYLTVTGLSAEQGDDGGVGRGNRASGLITPHRPMSMEAVAGKNPVNHVGKLYNVLARRIADRLCGQGDGGASYAAVGLLSQIGDPITEPRAVDVATTARDRHAVAAIVAEEVAAVGSLTEKIVAGEIEMF